jgi:hypothetical protein
MKAIGRNAKASMLGQTGDPFNVNSALASGCDDGMAEFAIVGDGSFWLLSINIRHSNCHSTTTGEC